MNKGLLLTAALLLSTGSAYATNEDISEFEHHAGAGQLEITPRVNQSWTSLKVSPGFGYDRDSDRATKTLAHVSAEYGVVPQLALGADVGYSTASVKELHGNGVEPRTNTDGFDDVLLYARGHVDLGKGKLAYGLNLDGATSKQTYRANGSVSSNSGGIYIQPYVGYERKFAANTLGVQGNFLYQADRSVREDFVGGADYKISGGNQTGAALFYEHEFEPALLGAAFIFNHLENSKNKTTTVAINDGDNEFGARIYSSVKAGKRVEILPEVEWTHTNYKNNGFTYDHANTVALQLAARFSF